MGIRVKKKEGENASAMLFRFNKKIKQSGVVKEVKRRRFRERAKSRQKVKLAALYRAHKQKELLRKRKLGIA